MSRLATPPSPAPEQALAFAAFKTDFEQGSKYTSKGVSAADARDRFECAVESAWRWYCIATEQPAAPMAFRIGERVSKRKGSAWHGRIVGTYSTTLTPEGYAVESEREPGSVQIYPAAALVRTPEQPAASDTPRGEGAEPWFADMASPYADDYAALTPPPAEPIPSAQGDDHIPKAGKMLATTPYRERAEKAEARVTQLEARETEIESEARDFHAALNAERVADLEAVVESAQALAGKLDLIHADDRYKAVWDAYMIRGGSYTGPTYEVELTALRAALAQHQGDA